MTLRLAIPVLIYVARAGWAQEQLAADKKLGSVSGVVVNSITGEPLSKATVTMVNNAPLAGRVNVPGSPATFFTTSTNSQGEFHFSDVAPSTYGISARRPGFIGKFGVSTVWQQLTITSGEDVTSFKARVVPQAILAGRVVDLDGEPLQDVFVSAMVKTTKDGRPLMKPVRSTSTNDLGEFRVNELPAGRYYVAANNNRSVFISSIAGVTKDTSDQSIYAHCFFPGVTDFSSATPVDVEAGTVRQGVEIVMRKVQARRVKGTVNLGRSNRVSLTIRRASAYDNMDAPPSASTAYDGAFEFHSVPPGSYVVIAEAETGLIKGTVEVGERDVEDLKLTVQPYITISGRLRWDGGPPPEFSKVRVDLDPVVFFGSNAKIEAAREFQAGHLVTGKMSIQIVGLGEQDYVKAIYYGNRAVEDETIDVMPSAELEIVLRRGTGSVIGTVEKNGEPAAGATVVLIPAKSSSRSLYRSCKSDATGHFEVRSAAPGDYSLLAFESIEPDAWLDTEFAAKYARDAEHITLEEKGRESKKLALIRSTDR